MNLCNMNLGIENLGNVNLGNMELVKVNYSLPAGTRFLLARLD